MIKTILNVMEILTPNQRNKFYLILFMMLIAMVLEAFSIGLIVPVVGIVSAPNFFSQYESIAFINEMLGYPSQKELIAFSMLVLSVAFIFKSIFVGIVSYFQSKFLFHIFPDISQRLFDKYLNMPYNFHLQRNSAELIKNILNEANLFNQTTVGLMVTLSESLVILAIVTLMIIVQPLAAIMVGGIFIICFLLYFFFLRKKMAVWGKTRQHHDGLRIQHVQQGLGSVKEIKLFGREVGFSSIFKKHNFGNADVLRKQYFMREVPRLGIESIAVVALAMVVIIISSGDHAETLIPTLALFAAAAFRVMPSLNRIIVMSSAVNFGESVVANLKRELSLSEEANFNSCKKEHLLKNEIHIEDINFKYVEEDDFILRDVNFKIKKGEMIGFIGGSGSGKTTLIDIILGLLKPTSGSIKIDGYNINTNLKSWQSLIGYVPQDVYLTDNTLKHNIAMGLADKQINENQIIKAYKDAQLDSFISNLNDGIETVVGERGARISGGQRQRIGIARALYNNPKILVMDESTSALDPKTERDILETINKLKGKLTILMITHRESSLKYCDKIVELTNGRIQENKQ